MNKCCRLFLSTGIWKTFWIDCDKKLLFGVGVVGWYCSKLIKLYNLKKSPELEITLQWKMNFIFIFFVIDFSKYCFVQSLLSILSFSSRLIKYQMKYFASTAVPKTFRKQATFVVFERCFTNSGILATFGNFFRLW